MFPGYSFSFSFSLPNLPGLLFYREREGRTRYLLKERKAKDKFELKTKKDKREREREKGKDSTRQKYQLWRRHTHILITTVFRKISQFFSLFFPREERQKEKANFTFRRVLLEFTHSHCVTSLSLCVCV